MYSLKFIVKSIFLIGIIIASLFTVKMQHNCIKLWKETSKKNRRLFILMNQWTNLKQEGKNLNEYFIKNNYTEIAIYGMGYVGLRLVKELRGSEINILYGIDKDAGNICSDIKLVTIDGNLLPVDAIVVTIVEGIDQIYDLLSKKLNCPIILIEDVLNEI